MKLIFKSLLLCVAVVTTLNASARVERPEYDTSNADVEFFGGTQFFKLPNFDIRLDVKGDVWTPRHNMGQIDLDVNLVSPSSSTKQKVGQILLQFYPEAYTYRGFPNKKILRIRWIEIDDEYKKRTYGTQALETLLVGLSREGCKTDHVMLEVQDLLEPHLSTWYEKHGFKMIQTTAQSGDVGLMRLEKAKFPLHAKIKAERAAAAAEEKEIEDA